MAEAAANGSPMAGCWISWERAASRGAGLQAISKVTCAMDVPDVPLVLWLVNANADNRESIRRSISCKSTALRGSSRDGFNPLILTAP